MIDLSVDTAAWDGDALAAAAQRVLAALVARLALPQNGPCVSILATDDATVATLNAEFRGKPTPTNVLSWPAQDLTPPDLPAPDFDGDIALGDIALAHGVCAAEAAAQNKLFDAHVTHLLLHGMLHLLGYDHETDLDAEVMEALEVEILGNLGISNPYSLDESRP